MKYGSIYEGRSAYYEAQSKGKPIPERQHAEIKICLACRTEPINCNGNCDKIKKLTK